MRLVRATISFCSASKEVSTSISLTCYGSVRSPPVTRRPAAANSSSGRLWASSRRRGVAGPCEHFSRMLWVRPSWVLVGIRK
jgi:hypothetical protein